MKKTVVIKIGSSVLMTKRGKFDEFRIAHIAKQINSLQEKGIGIVLVISGAVSYGSNFVDLTCLETIAKKASAGIGQIYLTSIFNKIFVQSKLQLAQILVTKEYLERDEQKNNIKNLIEFYLNSGYIPFFNENDVIDLNSFGGNDLLAAEVTILLNAQELIILSTMRGSVHGVGGGQTKLDAIDIVSKRNINAVIENGKKENVLIQKFL